MTKEMFIEMLVVIEGNGYYPFHCFATDGNNKGTMASLCLQRVQDVYAAVCKLIHDGNVHVIFAADFPGGVMVQNNEGDGSDFVAVYEFKDDWFNVILIPYKGTEKQPIIDSGKTVDALTEQVNKFYGLTKSKVNVHIKVG